MTRFVFSQPCGQVRKWLTCEFRPDAIKLTYRERTYIPATLECGFVGHFVGKVDFCILAKPWNFDPDAVSIGRNDYRFLMFPRTADSET